MPITISFLYVIFAHILFVTRLVERSIVPSVETEDELFSVDTSQRTDSTTYEITFYNQFQTPSIFFVVTSKYEDFMVFFGNRYQSEFYSLFQYKDKLCSTIRLAQMLKVE